MSMIVADRVKETTTTTGTGAVTLAGAVAGFRAFDDVCADGDEVFYCIAAQTPGEWEVGRGTYSADTLTRTEVLSSSTGLAVSFSAGTKDVRLVVPASRAEGALREITVVVSSAELLNLHNTPKVILPAASGAGYMPWAISVHKPAGTAYAGIAAGDDLVLETTSGTTYFTVETTGLLDQATAQTQVSRFGAGTVNTALADVGLRLRLLGAITTGDSALRVKLMYWQANPSA